MEIIIDELGGEKVKEIREWMEKYIIDIDLSDEIAVFVMTVFTCLRKEEYDQPGHLRFLEYNAKIGGIDISVKGVVEKIKSRAIKLNFLICTPIVEIITLFRSFYDEVRTGSRDLKPGNQSQGRGSRGREMAS